MWSCKRESLHTKCWDMEQDHVCDCEIVLMKMMFVLPFCVFDIIWLCENTQQTPWLYFLSRFDSIYAKFLYKSFGFAVFLGFSGLATGFLERRLSISDENWIFRWGVARTVEETHRRSGFHEKFPQPDNLREDSIVSSFFLFTCSWSFPSSRRNPRRTN